MGEGVESQYCSFGCLKQRNVQTLEQSLLEPCSPPAFRQACQAERIGINAFRFTKAPFHATTSHLTLHAKLLALIDKAH